MINSRDARQHIKKAANLPRGICPSGRRFAMRMQQRALEMAIAPWPRRASSLLEVNCGNGAFLHFLWQCGFAVEGCENDPCLRNKARLRNLPGIEIHAAADSNIPFDNDAFDWLVIHLKNGEKTDIQASIEEGARLSKRGFLLTFWNNSSFSALVWRLTSKKAWLETSASWGTVWRLLNAMHLGRLSTISTLNLPMCLWKQQWNPGGATSTPFGAWCIIRIDMDASPPFTALPLRLKNPLSPAEPALEPFSNEIVHRSPIKKLLFASGARERRIQFASSGNARIFFSNP